MRAALPILLALLCLHPARAHALAMQISNLSDLTLPVWSLGDPAPQATMDICIYGLNLPALLNYAITVSSSPSGFNLSNGAQQLPYSLYWSDAGAGSLGSSLGTQLADGVKLTGRSNHNILLANCGGSPNARLTLKITQAAMTSIPSGTYSGTVTLLLTPN